MAAGRSQAAAASPSPRIASPCVRADGAATRGSDSRESVVESRESGGEYQAATGHAAFRFCRLADVDRRHAQPASLEPPPCPRIRVGVDDRVANTEYVRGKRLRRIDRVKRQAVEVVGADPFGIDEQSIVTDRG